MFLVRKFGRIQFCSLFLLAMAALPGSLPQAVQAAPLPAQSIAPERLPFAQLSELTPGAVKPDGWLKLHLRKQAKFAEALTTMAWPFTAPFWNGGEAEITNKHRWTGWEQKGYWIDGALRCAIVLDDDALLQQALQPIKYTLDHADPDGYLGPAYLKDPATNELEPGITRWPHNVFFRALAAYGEATGDPRVAATMRRHYLADKDRLSSIYVQPSLSIANVEGMLWAYRYTHDHELLTMAEQTWQDYLHQSLPVSRPWCDLTPDRVLSDTPIRAHGVTYSEIAKLPAILYLHTGNPEYLRYAIATQERMFKHHMLIDGIPSASEEFRGTDALDAHETCNVTAMTWGWGYLLMATRDGLWADRIERAIFNAGFGSIRKDWKGLQYFSSPNQVIATDNSSHVAYGYAEMSKGWMAFRPVPAHSPACCAGNIQRLLPNYVMRMWMTDDQGGITTALYGPSSVRTAVGSDHEPVEIREDTNYPFEEEIRFTIGAARPVAFPLSLRIPGWCQEPHLSLNGEPLPLPNVDKGFIRIARTFRPGDRITLTLPMRVKLSFWPGTWAYSSVGLENGPLVYALGIKEDWTPHAIPGWSTEEYPDWEAKPASDWNYGVALGENSEDVLAARIKITHLPATDDPWVNPPVRMLVPMQRVPGWTLRHDPAHPEMTLTPPVPGFGANDNPEELVSLVPYGSTQLRVSIFPEQYPTPK
jgi:hypothetical protein